MEIHYFESESHFVKIAVRGLLRGSYALLVFLLLTTFIFSLGNLIVKNFVLRKGIGKLLDTLKEGVIIADSSDGELMFANAAAKSFNANLKEPLCVELGEAKHF